MKTKITYIVSDINKALAFEWVSIGLRDKGFDIRFVLLNPGDSHLENFLVSKKIPVKRITVRGKKDYPVAFLKLFFHLLFSRPKAIHCHLRDAELLGMWSAFFAGIKNRIYTRHSSTYNHLYHPNGVKIDAITNKMASKIVAISGNVQRVLHEMESVPLSKIDLIHHGFDFSLWQNVTQNQIDTIYSKHKIPKNKQIIGVIARYTWWKGYEYSIPAFGQLIKTHPDLHFVFANAKGNDQEGIKELLQNHLPKGSYTEITFEEDLAALYKVFDLYVHVPYDESVEAFGQTYVEALVAGIPSVFTLSGIAPDFIIDGQNALVVPFKNVNGITEACDKLLKSPDLCQSLIANGKQSVKKFELATFITNLEKLYNSL